MSEKTGPQLQTAAHPQMQLTQRLIMSAHMQQAIRLLQIPLQELEPFIEEQIVQNPILEISPEEKDDENTQEEIENFQEEKEEKEEEEEEEMMISDQDLSILNHLEEDMRDLFSQSESTPIKRSTEEDKYKTFLEQSICATPSLREQLLQQAHDSFDTTEEFDIAEIIIGYIDEYGFLNTPISEISQLHHLPEEEVRIILSEIQTFEPFGVGASSIQESLLIQLQCLHKEKTLAYQIVEDHYDQLLHNHIPLIQKQLKCSYEEIQEAIEKDIAKCDLHPGTLFSAPSAHPIIPDVIIRQENDQLIVEVEREKTPSLRINSRYLNMLNNPDVPKETKQFVKQHLISARWLVRNLEQRFSTIERITQSLAQKQYAFFTNPDGQLIPLTMKMIADELNLHESTIARTVSNKYLYCPRGLLPLRSFFTTKYISEEGEDLSATTVKEAILDLIDKEDKNFPLSDEKISLLLKEKGIICARRTVAKYRTLLQMGNTQQRRKFK